MGAFGAALVPLSQATMLDLYPPEQRGWEWRFLKGTKEDIQPVSKETLIATIKK